MQDRIRLLESELGESRVKLNLDVSDYLTSKKGSLVLGFYLATTSEEFIKSIMLCKELKIPFLIIGSGSKISLPEDGFEGVIIKNRSDHLKIFGIKGKVTKAGLNLESAKVEAESGLSIEGLLKYADKQGLGGLEVLRKMPGTIGGSLKNNVHLQNKVEVVKVLQTNNFLKIKNISQVGMDDIIISATFNLKANKHDN